MEDNKSEFKLWYQHGIKEGRLMTNSRIELEIRELRARLPMSTRIDQKIRLHGAIAGYVDVLIERGQNV